MKRILAIGLAALYAAGLTSCASVERVDAAGDVHAFLIAIRDNDRATFDAHVDRQALKREIESRLDQMVTTRTGDTGSRFVGALLAGPLARTAVEAALRPDVFRAIAVSLGYTPDKPIPGQFAIAQALRQVNDGQVCAAKSRKAPCLLTFTREGEVWKLTAVDVGSLKL